MNSTASLLDNLNPEQTQAVTHDKGPLLIVAGAGTGKTTVITRRVAHLIQTGVKPESILALAFGDKAAEEMVDRVDKLLPYGYYNVQISTFHSFGEQILKEYGLEIGLPEFKVLNEIGQWLLIRNNLDKFDLDYYRPLGNPTRFIKSLVTHFARAKDELVSPEEYLEYAEALRLSQDNTPDQEKVRNLSDIGEGWGEVSPIFEVANAYHVYQKLLLENNFLDFGDLINYSMELFQKRPRVLDLFRKRYQYILIDEFQDTNYAQYQLIKLLAAPDNNLTVVGDDDQSIYKFRGASISNILHFQKDYPGAKFLNLTKNYRTRQKILDHAHEFIKQNDPDRLEIKLGLSKLLESQRPGEAIFQQIFARDYLEEADLVIEQILKLKKDNPSLTWNDFAILARSHDALEPFLNKLEFYGLPHIYFANRGLYRKSLILDILAYFRLLDDYHESSALFRVLKLPVFHVSNTALVELSHFASRKTLSLYEASQQAAVLPVDGQSLLGVNQLLDLLAKHTKSARENTASQVFVEIIADLDLKKSVNTNTAQGVQNAKYLETFLRRIQDFQNQNTDKSLKNFIAQLSLELEAGEQGSLEADTESGPEAIKVLTVHGAKGLEFTYVFVVAMVDKRFPTIERKEPILLPTSLIKDILPVGDIHLEEERRLFYVAMTRARDGLFLTRARDYGGKLTKKPSRFLLELGLAKSEQSTATGVVGFAAPSGKSAVLPMPKYFSFSQISSFRKCPLEYKYRYVLKLPLPGNAQLSFGLTIHKTLERFLRLIKQGVNQQDLFGNVREQTLPSFAVLEKIYRESWVGDWYENKQQMTDYEKRGREIIRNFYDETQKHLPRPKYLEQNFRLRLGDDLILGKIDRADDAPDGLLIIDYKTGEARTKLSPVDKQQLLLYQWAAQDFLKEQISGLQYWYLKYKLEAETFLGTARDIEDLQKSFSEEIQNIKSAVKNNSFSEFDHRTNHECAFRHLE